MVVVMVVVVVAAEDRNATEGATLGILSCHSSTANLSYWCVGTLSLARVYSSGSSILGGHRSSCWCC